MRTVSQGLGRLLLLTAAAVTLTVLSFCTDPAHAALSPWSAVSPPWGSLSPIDDIYAFATTGLAAAGDGHIAVTRDGGRSWKISVPGGLGEAVFTAIAIDASGHGVVASGGLLLVSDDWGSTWHTPSYLGPAPGTAINDVAVRGSEAVAVGDDGLIMSSNDGGATWSRSARLTVSPITCVSIAGDGTGVAGSMGGEILISTAGTWTIAGTVAAPVISVAASSHPVWRDGEPDLFAATGSNVFGSDDALTFASLPGLPDLTPGPWPALASLDVPQQSLLLAGSQDAGVFSPLSRLWLRGTTGLGDTASAVATEGQSVAYLLGADGHMLRTLSAGHEPATIGLADASIAIGARTRLAATVNIGAPGAVLVQQRLPGGTWATIHTVSWMSNDWNRSVSFSVKPSLTHEYRLEFRYGRAVVVLASPVKVVVKPKITTKRSRYTLRVGSVYVFSGSVQPGLPGERVRLYTDRGGRWRLVSQGSIRLRNGRAWTSRSFGTPKAETYHLRAYLPATATHGEAWSRVVTVRIR